MLLHDGRLRLVKVLYRGSRSEVMEVLRDGKQLALKVVFTLGDEDAERFEREAASLARTSDPHVVAVLEHGRAPGGLGWILMPLLRGKTLRALLKDGKRLGVVRCCRMFDNYLSGLGAIHASGLVHRDIQPSNLFVGCDHTSDRSRGIVLDLGRALDEARQSFSTGSHLCGVLPYLAPEQLLGGRVDARTDLFSLGLVLYEALAGEPANRTDDPYQLLDCGVPELAASRPELAALSRVIVRATALRPEARYQSAHEFQRELSLAIKTCHAEAAA